MPHPKYFPLVVALGLALLGNGASALAQDTNIVGPPALRDFSISGERTAAPPAAEQPVAITPPPVSVPDPSPAPVQAQPAAPASASANAASAPPRQEQQAESRDVSEAEPAPVARTTQFEAVAESASPSQTGPVEVPTSVSTSPAPASGSGFPWLYILLGVVVAGAALLVLYRLRKGPEDAEFQQPVVDEPLLLVDPAASVVADPIVKVPAPRPWLELEFKPGKAAATDAQASVEYELKIANVGGGEARKVRIEARLFNAQQDQEIGAFFSAPDPAHATAAPRAIPPQGGAMFKSVVALPKDQVREVVVQGRRLFIPMVAFNVLYEWGNGEVGQTSMSYLVGRETEPPAEKMAPFRMDLGPRIYRSVGFRPSKLALTV